MRKLELCTAVAVLTTVVLSGTCLAQTLGSQQGEMRFMIAAAHLSQAVPEKVATLEDVKVEDHAGHLRINIKIDPVVTPQISEVEGPDRLVLDFPGTISALRHSRITVNKSGLSAIRVGIHEGEPPSTRLVLDLNALRTHEVSVSGGQVVLTLGAEKVVAQAPTSGNAGELTGQGKSGESTTSDPGKSTSALDAPPNLDPPAIASSAHEPEIGSAAPSNSLSGPANPAATQHSQPMRASGKEMRGSQPSNVSSGAGLPAQPGATVEPAAKMSGSGVSGPPASTALSVLQNKPLAILADPGSLQVSDSRGPSSAAQQDGGAVKNGDKAVTLSPSLPSLSASSNPTNVTAVAAENLNAPPLSSDAGDLPDAAATVDRSKVTGPKEVHETGQYVIGEQDQLTITVWKEPELSGMVVVRPDGKITVPLVNEIKVVGMTPAQLQEVLTEKLKPFINVPQVTVAVRQISSRNVFLIGEIAREGSFPINSSTTVLQIIAEAGGLRDFAKRKDIYVLRNEHGRQVRHRFNYDEVIRGKNSEQNIILQPGDTIVIP